MAVFTAVDLPALNDWLKNRTCGNAVNLEGISSGIENTNYFVTTQTGCYVLTLFEKLTAAQLPFYLQLMRWLANAGLPVPGPIADQDGELFSTLCGKPAAIVNCLPGKSVTQANTEQCQAIGEFCAKAHIAAKNFDLQLPNQRGLAWWQATEAQVRPFLPNELQGLLADEINIQTDLAQTNRYIELPRGPVHADLFRDNALFEGNRLGGVIDFYFAGVDTWIFDLAVCINDWCIDDASGRIKKAEAQAMLQGYQQHRAFTEGEIDAWPLILRAAALRFWISRLYDFYMPRQAEMLVPKDPTHFQRILQLRREGDIPSLGGA